VFESKYWIKKEVKSHQNRMLNQNKSQIAELEN